MLWKQLMRHHVHIMELDLRYTWPSVFTYDMQFRSRKACNLDLDFSTLDTDLMLTILTPDTLRDEPRVCYRCKSTFHFAKDCPFRTTHSLEAGASQKKTEDYGRAPSYNNYRGRGRGALPRNNTPYGQRSADVCINWNKGICRQGERCMRTHSCLQCGGRYPLYQCLACNQSQQWLSPPPINQQTTATQPSNVTNAFNNFPHQPFNLGRGNAPPS